MPRQRPALALIVSLTLLASGAAAQETQPAPSRWKIDSDGGITWNVAKGNAHADHIEMSGRFCSVIVDYGVDASAKPKLNRTIVWPMLRFHPNKTRDHLALTFSDDASPRIFMNRANLRNEVAT